MFPEPAMFQAGAAQLESTPQLHQSLEAFRTDEERRFFGVSFWGFLKKTTTKNPESSAE